MNVKELIEELQKCPSEARVRIWTPKEFDDVCYEICVGKFEVNLNEHEYETIVEIGFKEE